jgi:hypothetical protein
VEANQGPDPADSDAVILQGINGRAPEVESLAWPERIEREIEMLKQQVRHLIGLQIQTVDEDAPRRCAAGAHIEISSPERRELIAAVRRLELSVKDVRNILNLPTGGL